MVFVCFQVNLLEVSLIRNQFILINARRISLRGRKVFNDTQFGHRRSFHTRYEPLNTTHKNLYYQSLMKSLSMFFTVLRRTIYILIVINFFFIDYYFMN